MPWFGQGGKKGKSGNTELQLQRSKQIEALRRGNLGVVETLRDAEYRITIQIGTNNVTLIIKLPPQFPQDRPCVEVSPPVRHPWVDTNSVVVNCPSINGFSVHSSLLSAVQSVMEEFTKNPPVLVGSTAYQSTSRGYPSLYPTNNIFSNLYPPMTTYSGLSSTTSDTVNSQSDHTTSLSCTDTDHPLLQDFSQLNIAETFPDLKNKSNHDLLELMNEEDLVLDLIHGLPEVTQVVERRDEMARRCTQLAKENLAMKPVIEDLKSQLQEKYLELTRVQSEFESHQEEQVRLLEQFDPSVIHNNLKVAILEAEEESDSVYHDFVERRIDIETFTAMFVEKRTLYHSRRAKEDKMSHLLHKGF
ncbi:vacuolar protein sorting-associated protein 37A-like isoform X2 [Dreissena polymorpha]|uniref:VPS37 C-terminal domain-containing protein n=1 Tax=Dreissena polymorpha TaxID=45954 RepID=A0A9D4K799_DREPO|nr:vacuolar protein sorting-associated protein 37A-like isoform X2 [Dreissena polymorpha]KAH3834383.1 hypothetical protein DPMN_107706 [Dreissena polymorpha]